MAKAIFLVPFINSNPQVDMTVVQTATPKDGYGYSCIGHIPFTKTCLVLIESSDETLNALAEHPDYLYVEDAP